MARPKKEKKDLLSRYLKIRVTADEFINIHNKAKQANKSVSLYSREVLLKGVVIQTDRTKPQLLAHLGRVGNNVNQIAKNSNSAGGIRLNAREYRIIEETRDLLKQIAEDVAK